MRAQHGVRPVYAVVSAAFSVALFLLSCAALTASQKPEKAEKPEKTDLFDEIYRRSLPIASTLKTIRAHFTETTTSTLLARPLVAEGTLVAVRPSDLLITYTKPDRKIMRMDAKKMLFIWPDRHVRQEADIEQSQKRVQHYFVDKSPEELRRHFKIHATEDPQKPSTYLVELVPTRKQIKEGLSRIELWIDKSTLMLSSMRMTFPNGDTKTMALQDVELNGPVDLTSLDAETH